MRSKNLPSLLFKRKRVGAPKRELADQWRVLIKIAVSHPSRRHNEIDDIRPTQMRPTFGPCLKVRFLIALQLRPFEFLGMALILQRLLAGPTNCEATGAMGNQIWIFPGGLYRIEDDFQIRRDCNSTSAD
ncbi:MAG: hypothetical protein ACJ74Z_08320 [Bryobacteraceae bacterium]